MKLKQKMIMDGIMMILLLVLMNYDLTGGLIHEFLGIVILVGFIIHERESRNEEQGGLCDQHHSSVFSDIDVTQFCRGLKGAAAWYIRHVQKRDVGTHPYHMRCSASDMCIYPCMSACKNDKRVYRTVC